MKNKNKKNIQQFTLPSETEETSNVIDTTEEVETVVEEVEENLTDKEKDQKIDYLYTKKDLIKSRIPFYILTGILSFVILVFVITLIVLQSIK